MRLRLGLVAAATLALAACDSGSETSVPKTVAAAEATETAPTAAVVTAADDVLTSSGVADIRVGMTIAEVEALGREVTVTQPREAGSTCGFARIEGLDGLLAMLDGEKLVRFEVIDRSDEGGAVRPWHTAEGARIGSTEAELRRLYGSQLRIEPHPYTGPEGHYAVVHTEGSPDGIIFETDGARVLNWRVGQWEQVQWIEGCS